MDTERNEERASGEDDSRVAEPVSSQRAEDEREVRRGTLPKKSDQEDMVQDADEADQRFDAG